MKFLRKVFLRSPKTVYHMYAWWVGMRYVAHAFISVWVICMPFFLLIWAGTGSMFTASFLALLLPPTLIHVKQFFDSRHRPSRTFRDPKLWFSARVDKELTQLIQPICRKCDSVVTVMVSSGVQSEAMIWTLEKGLSAILVTPDIHVRYGPKAILGLLAHEIGHTQVMLKDFVREVIGANYFWLGDQLAVLSAKLFMHFQDGDNMKWGILNDIFVLGSWLSLRFWGYFSRARSSQLNEYAADALAASLLGDALPVAMTFARLMDLRSDFSGEKLDMLGSHPPFSERIERLLNVYHICHAR